MTATGKMTTADESGHVHDEACAAAHGDVVLPADQRRLVLVFASPVAAEMVALAGRLSWPVTVVEPDPEQGAGAAGPGSPGPGTVRSVADARLDAGCDVVVCDHDRPELGDVLAAALSGPTRWIGVVARAARPPPRNEGRNTGVSTTRSEGGTFLLSK